MATSKSFPVYDMPAISASTLFAPDVDWTGSVDVLDVVVLVEITGGRVGRMVEDAVDDMAIC